MERAGCIKNEVTQKESVQLFTTQKKTKNKAENNIFRDVVHGPGFRSCDSCPSSI